MQTNCILSVPIFTVRAMLAGYYNSYTHVTVYAECMYVF